MILYKRWDMMWWAGWGPSKGWLLADFSSLAVFLLLRPLGKGRKKEWPSRFYSWFEGKGVLISMIYLGRGMLIALIHFQVQRGEVDRIVEALRSLPDPHRAVLFWVPLRGFQQQTWLSYPGVSHHISGMPPTWLPDLWVYIKEERCDPPCGCSLPILVYQLWMKKCHRDASSDDRINP